MALLLQVNDYVGTLEPQVSMAIQNFKKSEESISYMAFSSVFKNCILIFLLVNMMQETRPREGTNVPLYVLYEFLMPIFVTLIICIPTTLAIKKQERYQRLTSQIPIGKFDVAIFIMTPMLANLVAETFSCSGFNTLLCCGLFNGLYSRRNLEPQKDMSVQQTVRYLAYILRQVSYVIIGIVSPFIILNQNLGLLHVAMAFFYNLSMVGIVWLLSYFAMPMIAYPC